MEHEILCASCSHAEVCSLKSIFERAQNAVNDVTVSLESKDPDSHALTRLNNISWIKPVKLECQHFLLRNTIYRDGLDGLHL